MLLFGGIRGWQGIFSGRAKRLVIQLTANDPQCAETNCLDKLICIFWTGEIVQIVAFEGFHRDTFKWIFTMFATQDNCRLLAV